MSNRDEGRNYDEHDHVTKASEGHDLQEPEVEGHLRGISSDVPAEQVGVVEPTGGTQGVETEEDEAGEVQGHMHSLLADRVAAERSGDLMREAERTRRSDQASSGQGGGVLGNLRDRLRNRGGD